MNSFLWLIPALPFLGAFILILGAGKLSKTLSGIIGAGSVGLAAIATIILGIDFLADPSQTIQQTLWTWVNVGRFQPAFAFHLDALSMVFLFVITFVGFLIHLYSIEFMHEDEG